MPKRGPKVKINRRGLTAAVDDAPLAEVVRGDFHHHRVPRNDANEVLPHAAGNVGNHLVAVGQFNSELGVGEGLFDPPFNLDGLFFRHGLDSHKKLPKEQSVPQPPTTSTGSRLPIAA